MPDYTAQVSVSIFRSVTDVTARASVPDFFWGKAVAWLRSLLSQSTPRAPAEETRDAYLTRLRAACAHVNDNFDVAGLNRELPGRVQQLLELKGDKLRK